MSEEDADSKIHEPTPKKLQEARKKGETPASQEIVSAAVFASLMISIAIFGETATSRFGASLSSYLSAPDRYFDGSSIMGSVVAASLAHAGAIMLLPLLALPFAAAILGYVAQGTVTFAQEKITPKLRRISPLQGAKQKFGKEGLFNFLKSFGKLAIYCALLGVIFMGAADELIHSSGLGVGGVLTQAAGLVSKFLVASAITMAIFGVVDLLWQRHSFFERQRMTQNELKDEMKESEGDPAQKGARRQRARELAATGDLSSVADADVVVVNPTHYAVALKWDRGRKTAPVCVAKGADLIAKRIRDIANENAVPIRSDPPTARVIFSTIAVGEEIRPEHFRAVAAAIRFADAIRARKT